MTTGEQIIVRVTADGSVHAETKGIKGPKCLDSIELLESLLDATAQSSAFTSEYTETSTASTTEVNDELHQR
ncbi:hypothetical protein GCM10009817_20950 [Terrabacter lapilli]|uniref:DUF2997 family protein n=1 Tax=Terrabacter lapilli TaxID=436231 RepID=A0ABN2S474_9MICO